jgi:hypothetical protein
MNERGYWYSCAETMELMVEGNRLIATELAGHARAGWRRMVRLMHRLLDAAGFSRA